MSIIKKEQTWLSTISLIVLAAVAIGVILLFARDVLIPFVLAVFIFQIASPILDFQMIRLKLPRSVAVVITLLVVGLFLALLCYLLIDALVTVLWTAKSYAAYFLDFADKVFAQIDQLTQRWNPSAAEGTGPPAVPAAAVMADLFG